MLRRVPEKILINALDANSVIVNGAGDVTIAGFGNLLASEVISCYKACPSDGTAQETTVEVVIPESCVCPYEWTLQINCFPNGQYTTGETFKTSRFYNYEDPNGAVPLAADVAAAVAGYINADKYSCVTASAAGDVITLTSKDTEHFFSAHSNSATIVTTQAGVKAVLSHSDMVRLFPIQPGHFGSDPKLARCGDYCVYHFVTRSTNDTQDISAANHYLGYEREVYFFVDSTLATFAADWDTDMLAQFPCLTPAS